MNGGDFYAYETGVLRSMLRTALMELQRHAPNSAALADLRLRWYAHENRIAARDAGTNRIGTTPRTGTGD